MVVYVIGNTSIKTQKLAESFCSQFADDWQLRVMQCCFYVGLGEKNLEFIELCCQLGLDVTCIFLSLFFPGKPTKKEIQQLLSQ